MQWVPSEKKEQPEEEPVCVAFIRTYVGKDEDGIEIWKEEPLYTTPPEPKPHVLFKTDNGWRKEEFEKTLVKKAPLDTTPPKPHVWFDFSNVPLDATSPQRKWVGLTEEERDHFEGLHLYAARNQVEAWIEGVPAFIDAIEAKLREKNGG